MEYIADYLLFLLNRHQLFDYVNVLNLDEPTDDIRVALTKIAIGLGKVALKTDLATGNH